MVKKLLIADQSDAIRSLAVNVFRQRGIEVLTAPDGAEAWGIIKGGKIDLCVINSSLTGMDGYTISQSIRNDSSLDKTKVILLLSPSEIVNQRQLISAQPDGTLSKPFSPPDLLEKVGEILDIDFATAEKKSKSDLTESVSELAVSDDEISDEIDFNSIFDDEGEESVEGEEKDVHLTDILSDHAEKNDEELPDIEEEEIELEEPEEKSKNDDSIRLEEDEFGMEKPHEEPEFEPPHDYNWFIREMKNEISGKPDSSREDDKKSLIDSDDPTGKFRVEEIKTSGHEILSDEDSKTDKKTGNTSKTISISDIHQKSKAKKTQPADKLALAESLLIKELARKLADKIASQIPRQKLLSMLDEILSELKKY